MSVRLLVFVVPGAMVLVSHYAYVIENNESAKKPSEEQWRQSLIIQNIKEGSLEVLYVC